MLSTIEAKRAFIGGGVLNGLDCVGFSAFAEITNGQAVVKSIVDKANDEITGDQDRMKFEGTDHLKTEEPFANTLVWIKSAYVKQ